MSAIGPLLIGAPVTGSWNVEPEGSMMWAANRPWPHEWMPSTWSWKKTVPASTSLYHAYWTNSVPAFSPLAWELVSGWDSTTVLPLITLISSSPAAADDVSVAAVVSGATDCSYEKPVMTPSDACGSNWTKCVCMLTLEWPWFSAVWASSLVSVTMSHWPTLSRTTNGLAGLVPFWTAALSSLSTKICPLWSTDPVGSMSPGLVSLP